MLIPVLFISNMSRIYFEETQTLKQTMLIWWIVISSFAFIVLPFLYGIYWQLIMNEPWGNKPMSNSGLVISCLFSFSIVGLIIWLTLNIKLEIKIDNDSIQYKYSPHMRDWISIRAAEIVDCKVSRLGFLQRGKRGYRGRLSKNKKIIVSGRNALTLNLKDRRIILGTQKPEELDYAVRKLLSKEEIES